MRAALIQIRQILQILRALHIFRAAPRILWSPQILQIPQIPQPDLPGPIQISQAFDLNCATERPSKRQPSGR